MFSLVRRILYGLLVLVLVSMLVSSIIYLAPVDPARLTFGQRSDAVSLSLKQKELGLDQPLPVQLLLYLNDLSPLSLHTPSAENANKYNHAPLFKVSEKVIVLKWPYLRRSFQSGRLVTDILANAFPKTAALALAAMLLALSIGIPLGILAAIRKDSWIDRLAVTLSTLGYSVPSYVSAILLALLFGYLWHEWTGLSVRGSLTTIAASGPRFGEEIIVWRNLILPALALGIRPVAILTQLTRSAMLDVLSQDYIRTARAKGASRRSLILRHALRNALNPVVTAATGWFAALLAGAFFVESVFAFRGLGSITVEALLSYDVPVVLGAVLLTCLVFICVNMLTDLIYRWIDPAART